MGNGHLGGQSFCTGINCCQYGRRTCLQRDHRTVNPRAQGQIPARGLFQPFIDIEERQASYPLPITSQVAARVLTTLNREEIVLEDLYELILSDPVLTSRTLRVAGVRADKTSEPMPVTLGAAKDVPLAQFSHCVLSSSPM